MRVAVVGVQRLAMKRRRVIFAVTGWYRLLLVCGGSAGVVDSDRVLAWIGDTNSERTLVVEIDVQRG